MYFIPAARQTTVLKRLSRFWRSGEVLATCQSLMLALAVQLGASRALEKRPFEINGAMTANLRAERSGKGSDAAYTDDSGNL